MIYCLDTNVIIDATNNRKNMNVALSNFRNHSAKDIVVPFTEKEAEIYGKIREELTKKGKLIGPNDMLIAATALANGAVLVTHNTDEFSRVPELKLEDWIK